MILNNTQQFHADYLRLTLDRLNGLGVGVKVDGGLIEFYPIDECVNSHRQMLPFIRCEPDKKWWEFWK